MNLHDGHEASCFCCKNCHAFEGDYGYSEETPGYSPGIECLKHVWKGNMLYGGPISFHQLVVLARDCQHFSAREESE